MVCFNNSSKDVAEFKVETLAMCMAARMNKEIAIFAASMLNDVDSKVVLHTEIVAQLVKSLLKIQREHDPKLAKASRRRILAAMMHTTEAAQAVAESEEINEQ